MRNRLFLFEALAITCGILVLFAALLQIVNIMLSTTVQEQAAELVKVRTEMSALRAEVEAVREESETHRRLKCQLNLLMVASRGGWNVAQVVLNEGLLESCELEAVSESD